MRNATVISALVGFLPLIWLSMVFGWGLAGIWSGLSAFMVLQAVSSAGGRSPADGRRNRLARRGFRTATAAQPYSLVRTATRVNPALSSRVAKDAGVDRVVGVAIVSGREFVAGETVRWRPAGPLAPQNPCDLAEQPGPVVSAGATWCRPVVVKQAAPEK